MKGVTACMSARMLRQKKRLWLSTGRLSNHSHILPRGHPPWEPPSDQTLNEWTAPYHQQTSKNSKEGNLRASSIFYPSHNRTQISTLSNGYTITLGGLGHYDKNLNEGEIDMQATCDTHSPSGPSSNGDIPSGQDSE
jgi:hypothetical protein